MVYPFALTLVRLEFFKAFIRARNALVISTVIVLPLYVSMFYSSSVHGNWWSPYPLYLLIPAVPEFLAIFAGDSISAARAIVAYESSLNLAVYGLSFVGIVAFAFFSPATVWLGAVLAVVLALLLWTLFYVFTHKGNSAGPYALLGFHLLDSLFIWGSILHTLASYF